MTMSKNRSNVFERHPKKTLVILIFIFFLLLDFGGAAALKLLGLFEPSYVSSKKYSRPLIVDRTRCFIILSKVV